MIAWEQRKLGEAVTFLNGRAYKQKELLDKGKYRVLRVGNFNTNDFWYYSDLELGDNKYANKGDLLYLWATNFGPEIWKEERVIYHYHIWKLDINDVNLDKNYLYTWLITDKERIKQTTNGTTMVHITKGGMEERLFQNPTNIDEQIKIGSFFEQLDESIALQECELELLKLIKKGFLQQLFTVKDEKYPNLRFANFHEAWIQCKFKKCFDFPIATNSLSRSLLNYEQGSVKSVHYGDVLIKYSNILNVKKDLIPYITNGLLEKYKSNLLKNGDLIFADAAEDETVGKAVEVNGITDENIVAGLHTIVARPKEKKAEYFLGYYMNSTIYHKQLLRLMQGSKVSSINKGNLQVTDVSFPKNFNEQSIVGNFFKQLDKTIILKNNELENLKKIKSSFLQKMFI
ncbi:restriction endonuclease subunit S [Vagococcus fluvialis]|uniref:restriction endonuclease subunit S n=1 Tax=Vagococcus fluvialis TaxID=2738 RepID=UPI00378D6AB3